MEPIENGEDFQILSNNLFKTLISATKSANSLPKGQDFAYYSGFPHFEKDFQDLNDRVLGLIQNLLIHENGENSDSNPSKMDPFDAIIEVGDNLLENVVRDHSIRPQNRRYHPIRIFADVSA